MSEKGIRTESGPKGTMKKPGNKKVSSARTTLRFGYHNIPLVMKGGNAILAVDRKKDGLVYRRKSLKGDREKLLLTKMGKLLVEPIEPVNTPGNMTPYLLIELENPLMLEPKNKRKVYVKFPIELGISISDGKKSEVIDIFSLRYQKYTLYGVPKGGTICKHWNSPVYLSVPSPNPLLEGVMELKINNPLNRWIEVTKAVFDAKGMKIYYNEDRVTMKANMRIISPLVAETTFVDAPIGNDMTKARDYFTGKMLSPMSAKYMMEMGI